MNQALDFSKSWSTTFNRFAWGAIAFYMAIYSLGFSDNLRSSLNSTVDFSLISVIGALAFVTFSLVLGNILISIGSFMGGDLVNDHTDTRRAVRVAETKNELLIQRYLEARLKLETSQGFDGLIVWFLFLIVLKIVLGQVNFTIAAGPTGAIEVAKSSLYAVLFGAVTTSFAIGLAKLVDWSAKRSISAIDDVLNISFPTPLNPQKQSPVPFAQDESIGAP